jgi:LPS-assembly protein
MPPTGAGALAAQAGSRPFALKEATRLRKHTLTDDEVPDYIEADRMDGSPGTDATLTGRAIVRRNDSIIKGEVIRYRQHEADITATGNVRVLRDTTLTTGTDLRYDLDRHAGSIEDAEFFLPEGGYVDASHADLFTRATMRLQNVTYSACNCDKPAWYIKSPQVDIDFNENEGVARNGVLYFKRVPILAAPYLTFPVKKERKSGFLMPTYGTTSRSGLEFSLPYYFNLARNYDMTLTPRYYAKRGTQLGGEFRYLGQSATGTLNSTYLGRDDQTRQSRWMVNSQHRQTFGQGMFVDWNFNRVSDDNYYRDFTTNLGFNEASRVHLDQRGRVGWGNTYWQTAATVHKYQTLQDPAAPINPPFHKEPELTLLGQHYNFHNMDVRLDTKATRFIRPRARGMQVIGPEGERLQAYPSVAYPIVRSGWYIIPKVGVHHTQYQGTKTFGDPLRLGNSTLYRRNQVRTIPIGSVDAGMTFERAGTLFGRSATQTLEPRLYYLNVPYRNQSRLPVYDTAIADFSFAQAFQENLYSGGWDRIANANQLTAAVTSRWLDANSGFERLSLSLGQRFYFAHQRVGVPYEALRDSRRSDFLVGASAALTDTLNTELAAQYDPQQSEPRRAMVSLRWSPQRLTTISLAYRYQRDPVRNSIYGVNGQNQVSLAAQWPFTQRWYGVGRIDYSFTKHQTAAIGMRADTSKSSHVTQAIAGLEYRGDGGWVGRGVFQRYVVLARETNTAFFLQLELTGLGALGTDPLGLLNKRVPGYQKITPPGTTATAFERYE